MIKLLQKQNGAVFYASQCSCKHNDNNDTDLFQIIKGFPSCEIPQMVFHWLLQSPLQQVSTTVLPVMEIMKWTIS